MARSGRGYNNSPIIVTGHIGGQDVSPTAIDSLEAFGSTAVINNQIVSPTAIASSEAFGTAQLNLTITVSGIASGEAFGTATIAYVITPTAIDSAETFGSTTVIRQQFITPTGIDSAEAFGTDSLTIGHLQEIACQGIASAEEVMFPTVSLLSQFVLRPPTVQETPMGDNVLHIRYGIHRGISILKRSDGTYYSTRFPAQTEIEGALANYLGGHVYIISSTVRDELISAGYGSYITLEDA